MSKYKIVQLDYALYGEGETFDEACEDAIGWLEFPRTIDDVKKMLVDRQNCFSGSMTMLRKKDDDFNEYQKERK